MTITQATNKNVDTIKNLMLSALKTDPLAFTVSFDEYNKEPEYWWHNYLAMYVGSMYGAMYLIEVEGKHVGMVGVLYNRRERQKHVATIVWLYVLPDFRKQRLARNLMDHIISEISKNKEIKKINLTVTQKQTAAINLYKNLGFTIAGIQKNELKIEDEYIDFLQMEKMI